MPNHHKILTFGLLALLAAAVYFLFNPSHNPAQSAAPAQVCANPASPCIKLTGPDGQTVARFNDFRFIAGTKCIIWRLGFGTPWHRYCNGHMVWVGPERATSAHYPRATIKTK